MPKGTRRNVNKTKRRTIVHMQVSWYTFSGLFDLVIIKLSKFVPRLSSAVQVVQGPRDTPVPNTKTAFKIVQGPSSIPGPNTKADYMIVKGLHNTPVAKQNKTT